MNNALALGPKAHSIHRAVGASPRPQAHEPARHAAEGGPRNFAGANFAPANSDGQGCRERPGRDHGPNGRAPLKPGTEGRAGRSAQNLQKSSENGRFGVADWGGTTTPPQGVLCALCQKALDMVYNGCYDTERRWLVWRKIELGFE